MTIASTLARSTRPRVLFVDRDGGSPQIAASLFRQLAGDQVDVFTAVTKPVDPTSRSDEMLVGMGLNPADKQPLSSRQLHAADRVIVLGTDLDVARLPGPRYEAWDLTQDDIASRVQTLSEEFTAEPSAEPRLLHRLRHRLTRIWRR